MIHSIREESHPTRPVDYVRLSRQVPDGLGIRCVKGKMERCGNDFTEAYLDNISAMKGGAAT